MMVSQRDFCKQNNNLDRAAYISCHQMNRPVRTRLPLEIIKHFYLIYLGLGENEIIMKIYTRNNQNVQHCNVLF